MKRYHPIDSIDSPKFCGVRTFMRLPHIQTTEGVDFAVVGIPFDTGSNYRTGSRFGPQSIRNVSAMIRPYNPILKVNVFDYASGIDYGDIDVNPGDIEDTYKRIEEGLQPILAAGVIPICLGGDHSITLGELRAIAKQYGPVALVQFDSHVDTEKEQFGLKYNHGTPFRRAIEEGIIDASHSIQVGIRGSLYYPDDLKEAEDLGFKVITANDMRELGLAEVGRQIRERVGSKLAFFTFDIDFVDPSCAPGTGTTEVGGFNSHETLSLIRETKALDFVGFDIVEVLPAYDPTEITANLAANIGYEFASIIALHKREDPAYPTSKT